MGDTAEIFDENHAANAAEFWLFMAGTGQFDPNDPSDQIVMAEASAFSAIVTDERGNHAPVTDERIAEAAELVQRIVPINPSKGA